jgi:hypothetical protein
MSNPAAQYDGLKVAKYKSCFLGISMGPAVCKSLRKTYGDKIACQGISAADGYSAGIGDNMIRPKGTSEASIAAAVKMFTLAHTKCPSSAIIFSGYRYVFKFHLVVEDCRKEYVH